MASHSYWGFIAYPKAGSGNGVSLAEVEMRGSVGGVDLCSGGSAVGSGSSPAANAFDNDLATIWYNGAAPSGALLAYSFASPVEVVEMAVWLAGSGTSNPGATSGPNNLAVVYSDDGVAWKFTASSAATNTFTSGDSLVFPVSDAPLNPKTADSPLRLLGAATPAANWKVGPNPPILLRDTINGGFGQIIGTVKEKATPTNVPLRRKVRLFHELSGRFLRETWSDDAGNYAFTGIDPTQRYTVVSYDYLQNYRAVIADNILPEVMA